MTERAREGADLLLVLQIDVGAYLFRRCLHRARHLSPRVGEGEGAEPG